ncbi:unnamed protein product [Nesidiocoris tenuis]|uniref:SNRNP25 ubiquitin-like domain-containing protein n=1 Tax=Nesidiocoris tenuis TaxID=355587 RepID=A0A6H5HCD9_9HEMI|nr:unnamed protein product [Nesidiocoris tenuis]
MTSPAEDERVLFSHDELMEITKSTLKELIASDELLSYLPPDVTAEEVAAELALRHGQSMSINLHKENGQIWKVVVPKGGRVVDLKRAIRRSVNAQLAREGVKKKISWRYVWRTNHLAFEGQILDDDSALLVDVGIRNKCDLRFVKRRREKNFSNRRLSKKSDFSGTDNNIQILNRVPKRTLRAKAHEQYRFALILLKILSSHENVGNCLRNSRSNSSLKEITRFESWSTTASKSTTDETASSLKTDSDDLGSDFEAWAASQEVLADWKSKVERMEKQKQTLRSWMSETVVKVHGNIKKMIEFTENVQNGRAKKPEPDSMYSNCSSAEDLSIISSTLMVDCVSSADSSGQLTPETKKTSSAENNGLEADNHQIRDTEERISGSKNPEEIFQRMPVQRRNFFSGHNRRCDVLRNSMAKIAPRKYVNPAYAHVKSRNDRTDKSVSTEMETASKPSWKLLKIPPDDDSDVTASSCEEKVKRKTDFSEILAFSVDRYRLTRFLFGVKENPFGQMVSQGCFQFGRLLTAVRHVDARLDDEREERQRAERLLAIATWNGRISDFYRRLSATKTIRHEDHPPTASLRGSTAD